MERARASPCPWNSRAHRRAEPHQNIGLGRAQGHPRKRPRREGRAAGRLRRNAGRAAGRLLLNAGRAAGRLRGNAGCTALGIWADKLLEGEKLLETRAHSTSSVGIDRMGGFLAAHHQESDAERIYFVCGLRRGSRRRQPCHPRALAALGSDARTRIQWASIEYMFY